MNINIGLKIKNLRSKKQITQEQLATYLGVTPQAISRWESGNGYPDIETLPALSDFFTVTCDELLGIKKEERDQRLAEVLIEVNRLEEVGTSEENLLYARNAVAEFPSEKKLQVNLADRICQAYMWEESPNKVLLEEAEKIYLTVIDDSSDNEIKFSVIEKLCSLYSYGFKNVEKATEIANRLPSMKYSREYVKSYALEGELVAEYTQDYIEKLTDGLGTGILNLVINSNVPNDPSTWDKKIAMMETSIHLYHLIFGDDLKFYNCRIAFSYRIIATYKISQGKNSEALDTLEKMCDYTIAYDNRKHGEIYTSPLVDLMSYPYPSEELHEYTEHNMSWYVLNQKLTQERYNQIRSEDRFRKIEAKLRQYAK